MKSVLDRFDQAPLWIRVTTLAVLFCLLVLGLFFVKNDQAQPDTARTAASSQSSSENSASSEKTEEAAGKAEQAVKHLEDTHDAADIAPAQTAVDQVDDQAVRARLQERIQAVNDVIVGQIEAGGWEAADPAAE